MSIQFALVISVLAGLVFWSAGSSRRQAVQEVASNNLLPLLLFLGGVGFIAFLNSL